jgi:hypothetical protein
MGILGKNRIQPRPFPFECPMLFHIFEPVQIEICKIAVFHNAVEIALDAVAFFIEVLVQVIEDFPDRYFDDMLRHFVCALLSLKKFLMQVHELVQFVIADFLFWVNCTI